MSTTTKNERAVATPQPAVPEGYDDYRPDDFTVRITRADTWLARAREIRQTGDLDLTFLLHWIAFNAAYARDVPREFADREQAERTGFGRFLRRLVSLDRPEMIHEVISVPLWRYICPVLDNKYLFSPYWHYANGRADYAHWKWRLENDGKRARDALSRHKTATTLTILFQRLYTLRNQLVHGGARWDSQRNRGSVENALPIMERLVPMFVDIMRNNRDDWGQPYYRPGLELSRRER